MVVVMVVQVVIDSARFRASLILLARGLCICIDFDVGGSAVGGEIARGRTRREADRYAGHDGRWW